MRRGNDFVVIVRRWRQQGPRRPPGPWTPIGVAADAALASVMAEALAAEHADDEARAVGRDQLAREFGVEARERILELLSNPTIAESAQAAALREEAAVRRRDGHGRAAH